MPVSRAFRWISRLATGSLLLCCVVNPSLSQEFTQKQREQAQAMLKDVANDVKENYYDPHLHGIDWDAKVREAKEKIDKADSFNRALSDIAAALDSLNDSHTAFMPPPRPYVHDYGFQMQMIGDRCYVTRVRPGSDAEAKRLKPGDEIRAVNGYMPTRKDFWRMQYIFWILRPQQSLRLSILSFDGGERQVDVIPKFRQLPKVKDLFQMNEFDIDREMDDLEHSSRVRFFNSNYDLLIVKLPQFLDLPVGEADSIVSKMEGYKAVLFDLRGDPGGSEEMLKSLLGGVFDHKVKIGDRVGRKSTEQLNTGHHFYRFKGKLAVLVDSRSASASEIFARVIQLEKRGVVLGDRSSGMVMGAKQYIHKTDGSASDSFIAYGAEVTGYDLIMADGQSLERNGVIPDILALPTASDLSSGRDPVLSKAAELLNVTMSPEEAGKLFPFEWPKE
jgi:carboxyl-terminal processing protease